MIQPPTTPAQSVDQQHGLPDAEKDLRTGHIILLGLEELKEATGGRTSGGAMTRATEIDDFSHGSGNSSPLANSHLDYAINALS